jgi:hypothetical protein
MISSREYVYKVLKGAWGIRISLTAEARRTERLEHDDVLVSPRIWISGQVAGRPLSNSEIDTLVRGLRFLVDEIGQAVSYEPLVIVIRDLRYVESDFQEEGLTAAIFGWAIAEFGLNPREIDVSFNKDANRYNFAWPSLDGG